MKETFEYFNKMHLEMSTTATSLFIASLVASLAKLLYRVSGIGSHKCLHPVAYLFLTL